MKMTEQAAKVMYCPNGGACHASDCMLALVAKTRPELQDPGPIKVSASASAPRL